MVTRYLRFRFKLKLLWSPVTPALRKLTWALFLAVLRAPKQIKKLPNTVLVTELCKNQTGLKSSVVWLGANQSTIVA